ncbi:hypothetical protein VT03_22555 [Planctomyces sp. SH-PL14]|nr:hypothetical protein VT03_22555 [Planctomyces sp. SH-PL14]
MGHNGYPLCGPRVEDSLNQSRWLCNPRVSGEGTYGTVSAFGHALLQTSLDGQPPAGKGDSPPCIP